MILMPLVMVAPLLALPLFYYFPLATALPLYIVILIPSVYCNVVMISSMRAREKSGVKAMIGKKALVIKDIAPEGKVKLWGEIWTARAGDKLIPAGQEVKILDVRGLILIVGEFDVKDPEQTDRSWTGHGDGC